MQPLSPITSNQLTASSSAEGAKPATTDMSEDAKLRFEKLLWAELLTHTGLEKAMTLGGGEGAFTMYTCDLTHGYVDINGAYRT